jgi:hypothetical protein
VVPLGAGPNSGSNCDKALLAIPIFTINSRILAFDKYTTVGRTGHRTPPAATSGEGKQLSFELRWSSPVPATGRQVLSWWAAYGRLPGIRSSFIGGVSVRLFLPQ